MEQAAVDLNEYCIALLLFGMKEGLTSRESRFDLLVSLFVCALCVLYGKRCLIRREVLTGGEPSNSDCFSCPVYCLQKNSCQLGQSYL